MVRPILRIIALFFVLILPGFITGKLFLGTYEDSKEHNKDKFSRWRYNFIITYKKKVKYTQHILRSYKSLTQVYKLVKIGAGIIWLLVRFLCASLMALVRIIMVWLLPERRYRRLKKLVLTFFYNLNELYEDLTVRGYKKRLAIKRFKLREAIFFNGREVDRSYGRENPDKTFFVIRPYYYSHPNEAISAVPHLLTNYYYVLQLMAYAKENGWIPVVDWENYRLPHSEDDPVNGTRNAWEYYWKQLSPYTLEEVYRSKNVVLSNMNIPSGYLPHLRTPESGLEAYAKRIVKLGSKYACQVSFNHYVQAYIDAAKRKIFPKGKLVMGVAVRGTAYLTMQTGHHAAQPTLDELVGFVAKYMKLWGADYIFFTNEEEETIEFMRNAFGRRLLYLPRKRYRGYHIYSDNKPDPTDEDLNPLYVVGQRYQTNLDYVTEMVLLSQCDFLLSALSNGVKVALMWGGDKFKQIKIIDKGVYKESWQKK